MSAHRLSAAPVISHRRRASRLHEGGADHPRLRRLPAADPTLLVFTGQHYDRR